MAEEYLRRVYDLQNQDETDAYYSSWASTYDRELIRNGYRTPKRCAEALAQFVAGNAAVLDVGCGTGLSGAALAAAGFTDISGQDVNADMLDRARATGLYRETRLTDHATPFSPGTYDALDLVITAGRAEQVFAEDGPHFDALSTRSRVYVLRRLATGST